MFFPLYLQVQLTVCNANQSVCTCKRHPPAVWKWYSSWLQIPTYIAFEFAFPCSCLSAALLLLSRHLCWLCLARPLLSFAASATFLRDKIWRPHDFHTSYTLRLCFLFNNLFDFGRCLQSWSGWKGSRAREKCDHFFLNFLFFLSVSGGKGDDKGRSHMEPPTHPSSQEWGAAAWKPIVPMLRILQGFCPGGCVSFEILSVSQIHGWENPSSANWLTQLPLESPFILILAATL